MAVLTRVVSVNVTHDPSANQRPESDAYDVPPAKTAVEQGDPRVEGGLNREVPSPDVSSGRPSVGIRDRVVRLVEAEVAQAITHGRRWP